MEKDLSHQIDVDVEILLGRVDIVMAQHLFDRIHRLTQVEKILGIGVTQGVGGKGESCALHGFGDALTHTGGLQRWVWKREANKEMS